MMKKVMNERAFFYALILICSTKSVKIMNTGLWGGPFALLPLPEKRRYQRIIPSDEISGNLTNDPLLRAKLAEELQRNDLIRFGHVPFNLQRIKENNKTKISYIPPGSYNTQYLEFMDSDGKIILIDIKGLTYCILVSSTGESSNFTMQYILYSVETKESYVLRQVRGVAEAMDLHYLLQISSPEAYSD